MKNKRFSYRPNATSYIFSKQIALLFKNASFLKHIFLNLIVHQKAKRSLSSIHSSHVVNFNTIRINTNTSAITPMNNVITANIGNNTSNNVSLLQPRPETLAVLSKDSFAEKCARKQEDGQQQQPIEKVPAQIPFIEDDYDEV